MDDGRFPVEVAGGVPVVAVPVELDITNAPRLEPALAEAAAKGHGRFVVDMSRTRFCDCAGLHVLLAAHKRARTDGGGLVLAIGGRAVLRLFEITGAGSVIPCSASLEEALARASCDGSGGRRADGAAEAGDGHVPQGSTAPGRSGSPAASSTTTHSMMPETRQLWRWVSSSPGGVMLMADDTLAAGLACGGGWYRVFRTTDDVPAMPSGLRPGRMR